MQDKQSYILIMQRLSVQALGRWAQTCRRNRSQSSVDEIWRPLFLRDFGTNIIHLGGNRHLILSDFKKAYKQFRHLLPLLHATDVSELAAQMHILAHLFTQPHPKYKQQIRLVWSRTSTDGSIITRQNGVRHTYQKIRDLERDENARSTKKSRPDSQPTQDYDETDLVEFYSNN